MNRSDLFAELVYLYAELGWALPTSIEYASLELMRDSADMARRALVGR
jgi:hypothetical protein